MSWLFCCNQIPNTTSHNHNLIPQPLKFKIFRSLGLLDPLLSLIILPKKKQQYKFPRDRLYFLTWDNLSNIPILYFDSRNASINFDNNKCLTTRDNINSTNIGQKMNNSRNSYNHNHDYSLSYGTSSDRKKQLQEHILLIYCHGSGSNLNNVYNFGANIYKQYDISVLLYDYTGDGQSNRQFVNYENDIKTVLSWATIVEGYKLHNIILCGFSIGSYSALCVPGPMPRLLISPICGIISFVEGTNLQYEGQMYDNIANAERVQARTLIMHGSDQMIPYNHAQVIVDSLRMRNNADSIQLYKVEKVSHLDMPNVLCKNQAYEMMSNFFQKVRGDIKDYKQNYQCKKLMQDLEKMSEKLTISKTQRNINK